MGKLRSLASDTAWYGLSSIIGRSINFLLVPFLTEVLTVGEYGEIGAVYAKIAFLNVILTFGLETTYFRFVSRNQNDEKQVFNNAVTFIICLSIFISVLLFTFDTAIVNFLALPGREVLVRLSALIVAIDAIVAIPFAKLRLERRPKRFAFYKLINIFIYVFLNVFFLFLCKGIYEGKFFSGLSSLVDLVYLPKLDAEYVLISNLIANALFIIMLWKSFKGYRFKFDNGQLRKMLNYAYPIVIAGLAYATNEMFSRLMLIKWLPEGLYPGITNKEALGIFNGVIKMAVFLNIAIQAFRYAAEPFFFSQSQDKNSKKTFARVFYYFVIVGSLAVLGISLNLEFFKYFLSNETYWQGLHIVPILLVGSFFYGAFVNFSIWYKLTDQTYYGTYISVIGAFITILFNYLLIPVIGYEGSAITTLLTYAFMMIAVYITGQKNYRIPYNINAASFYFFFAIILLLIGWYIDLGNKMANQTFKEVLILVYIAIAYLYERKRIRVINK